MYLLYCFLAFLSLGLHNASKNIAREEGDIPNIYGSIKFDIWFFISGLLIPVVVLFVYSKWFLAFVYIVVGVLSTMILSNQYMYKMNMRGADARPSIVISAISIIVLLSLIL